MADVVSIMESLLYGNTTLGFQGFVNRYSPLDELWFGTRCLNIRSGGCLEQTSLEQAYYNHGLNGIFRNFLDSAKTSLAYGKCPESVCGPMTRARMENFTALGMVHHQIDDYLDQALKLSVDYLVDEIVISGKVVDTVEAAILAFNIIFLTILYVFLFYPMIVRLQAESSRTSQLLMLYPKSIIAEIPFFQHYFVKVRE